MTEVAHTDDGRKPRHPFGWQRPGDSTMNDPEFVALEEEAERVQGLPGYMLEVGVYHARTTVLLAQIGRVIAVDHMGGNVELAPKEVRPSSTDRSSTGWDPKYQFSFIIDNLRRYPGVYRNVVLIMAPSDEALPLLPGPFKLALLDADKSEESVLADIARVWPKIVPGGTLFMDDWLGSTVDEKEPGTVRRAWIRFAEREGLSNLVVDLFGYQPGSTVPKVPKLARVRKLA